MSVQTALVRMEARVRTSSTILSARAPLDGKAKRVWLVSVFTKSNSTYIKIYGDTSVLSIQREKATIYLNIYMYILLKIIEGPQLINTHLMYFSQ